MNEPFLYDMPILPTGFSFPQSYLTLVHGHDLPDLEPWSFLCFTMAKSLNYYGALLQKYSDKPLIPFAIAHDQSGFFNDGYVVLACFDGDDRSGNPKVYFHDYSNAKRVDWSERYSLANFSEWLNVVVEESARYKAQRAEGEGG